MAYGHHPRPTLSSHATTFFPFDLLDFLVWSFSGILFLLSSFLFPLSSFLFPLSSFLFPLSSFFFSALFFVFFISFTSYLTTAYKTRLLYLTNSPIFWKFGI